MSFSQQTLTSCPENINKISLFFLARNKVILNILIESRGIVNKTPLVYARNGFKYLQLIIHN